MADSNRNGPWGRLILLALVLAAVVLLVAGLGFVRVPLAEVVRIIGAKLVGASSWLADLEETHRYVVWDVRLPRILTSALVGAGLGAAGCVFQGILLNPLADPYTLGVSAGAAFGASLAIMLNLTLFGPYSISVAAFIGAAASLAVVIWLARAGEGYSSQNLILSGVIVAAILAAGIGLMKYLAEEQVGVIIFWLMGSFVAKTWLEAGLTLTWVLIGLAAAFYYARDLNLLALGGRSAAALGVETGKVRLVLLIAASLMTAGCVAVSGIVGFVGLIAPHLMRFLVGPDNRTLLPASALAGAVLLLAADTVTRTVLPNEAPIGVLTALIGGPYFCYIFRKRQLGSYGR